MDFQFYLDYVLENNRVKLIPLQERHFSDLLPISISEPELWAYSLLSASGEDNLQNYIKLALEARERELGYPFVVYDKLVSKFAGTTRLYEVSLLQKTLSLGFTWYGKEFQGTGLNKACKHLLLAFVFEKMKMERAEFRADTRNLKSIAALKSIGCKEEGILRSNGVALDGARRDSVVLSILKSEWENEIKVNLAKNL